ncbi:MAG TPA: hypothetical protein VKB19_13385, partial [Pedobacter sp.]|nr:hypothetical protein [Pedobacter sp.]
MKLRLRFFFIVILVVFAAPSILNAQKSSTKTDWLLNSFPYKASVKVSDQRDEVILSNGLVRRSFRLSPNVVCFDYLNVTSGQQLLRSLKAEARLTINQVDYNIGGLSGQKENAYLRPEWINTFTTGESDFKFIGFTTGPALPYVNSKRKFWALNHSQPKGQKISFSYKAGVKALEGLT